MFTHLSSSLWTLFKVLACYAISGKRFFAVSLMKSLKSWRPWGQGYGLLHISYKVWKTSLTKQIGYLLIHKFNVLSLKKIQKPYHPRSNKYSPWMRACGSSSYRQRSLDLLASLKIQFSLSLRHQTNIQKFWFSSVPSMCYSLSS